VERRVLVVSLRADPLAVYAGGAIGGQQVMVRSVARAVQAFGFGVDVLAASGQVDPGRAALGHLGRVVRLPGGEGLESDADWLAAVPRLLEAARHWVAGEGRRRYRLVHSYSWLSGAVAGPLAQELGIPWIHSPGMVPPPQDVGPDPVTVIAPQLHEADWVVVTSAELAQRVRGWAPTARCRVIPPGIDPSTFFPRDAGPSLRRLGLTQRVVLAVSGSVEDGPTQAMLQAWREAVVRDRTYAEAWLLLVGPGTERFTDEAAHIRGMGGVARRVLPGYFAAAAVSVVPSQHTQALAALESMASAVPVVGYRVAGVEDVVVDGETGVLCEPGNARALVEAALSLWQDAERARRMGRAGEQRVLQGYTVTHLGEAMAGLYHEAALAGDARAQA
jgi:D-inositol-3-phosphate glycosyltransferase